MQRGHYNPYKDMSLHANQPVSKPQPLDDRCGFNDVIETYDIVNGHQFPKRLDHLPRAIRGVFRWTIILWVSSFIVFQVWSVVSMLK
ncbi:hypothetical protein XYCOK13_24570 [Xylanibacillus composti]|uniref:Uncharacterized protein n=1 Tax=Xylanibacillus composti TaxID=1572762 RepID=A0A8J4H6Y1_9BACL|nr:hypothetical protein [Xylanibacillus composti]GIQ69633.1 hypothetical protein XYCOK13_24570 [Xylanibacillus composti]